MEWDKKILEIVPYYDFVLLDSTFLNKITDEIDINLCDKIYDLKYFTQIIQFKENFEDLHKGLSWKLDNIIKRENVFTIQGVVDEIDRFKEILSRIYIWYDTNYRVVQSRTGFKSGRCLSVSNYISVKRHNFILEKTMDRVKINEIDLNEEREELNLLNCLVMDLEKVIKNLKIYNHTIKFHLSGVGGATKTDYNLVKAAIDYYEKNYGFKVAIISNDKHIKQIRDNNFLEECFHVIDAKNFEEIFIGLCD